MSFGGREDLKNGKKVLFIGTPCQCFGLKSFLRKEYEQLITIDLICHGVPSRSLLEQHAETGGTSGEFDGGILIETRKDGIVTHNIRVCGADKICVDKDNSTVYKISDDDYKTLEKVMDNYKL